MHRYTIAKRLGDGTYGEVVRAINKQSGEVREIVVQIMDKGTVLMLPLCSEPAWDCLHDSVPKSIAFCI